MVGIVKDIPTAFVANAAKARSRRHACLRLLLLTFPHIIYVVVTKLNSCRNCASYNLWHASKQECRLTAAPSGEMANCWMSFGSIDEIRRPVAMRAKASRQMVAGEGAATGRLPVRAKPL